MKVLLKILLLVAVAVAIQAAIYLPSLRPSKTDFDANYDASRMYAYIAKCVSERQEEFDKVSREDPKRLSAMYRELEQQYIEKRSQGTLPPLSVSGDRLWYPPKE